MTRAVERVRTRDGRVIQCDFVVVGVGVQPRIQLAAEEPGLAVDDGVLVDEHLATNTPGVFAGGDVATPTIPSRHAHPRRHWDNALHSGRPPPGTCWATRLRRLPYFYSDQYDVGMEYSGLGRDPTRSCSGAIRETRVHRLLDHQRPRARWHERQRVGRQDSIRASSASGSRRSTTDASPCPTSRSTNLSHLQRGGTKHEPSPGPPREWGSR